MNSKYQQFCKSLWKSENKTPEMQLAIAALGLVGESGETADFIKKSLRNTDYPIQIDKIKLELGDVLYYVCTIATLLGFSIEEIIAANMEKLTNRNNEGSIIDPNKRIDQYALWDTDGRKISWSEPTPNLMEKLIDKAIELSHKAKVDEFQSIIKSGDISALADFCKRENIEMSRLSEENGFSDWLKRATVHIKNGQSGEVFRSVDDCIKYQNLSAELTERGYKPYVPINQGIEILQQSFKFDSTQNGVDDGFEVFAVDLEGNKTKIEPESSVDDDNDVKWDFTESSEYESLTEEQRGWRDKMISQLAVSKEEIGNSYPEAEIVTGQFDFAITPAYALIQEERRRQIYEENHAIEFDDTHTKSELLRAALTYENCVYAKEIQGDIIAPETWPWPAKWFKPKSYKSNLIRAGALVEAEIDRKERWVAPFEASQEERSELLKHLRRICGKLTTVLEKEKLDEK